MFVREPDTRSPAFYATMWVLGLVIDVLFMVTLTAADKLDLALTLPGQGLMFLLGLSLVYLGAQILHARLGIPLVAGMSLSLLAALLSWVATVGIAMLVLACFGMVIVSFVYVPLAWLRSLSRRASKPRGAGKTMLRTPASGTAG